MPITHYLPIIPKLVTLHYTLPLHCTIIPSLIKLTINIHTCLFFYFFQRKTYIKHVRVFPPVKFLKWKLSPHVYRKAIGGAEVTCGVILAFIPGKIL